MNLNFLEYDTDSISTLDKYISLDSNQIRVGLFILNQRRFGIDHVKTADRGGCGFEERHISVVVELKFCNDEYLIFSGMKRSWLKRS